MGIDEIIHQRKAALLHEFAHGAMPPLVEVEDSKGLGSLMHLDEFGAGAAGGSLGRRWTGNVVMVAGNGRPHGASLWVRASYKDYRAAYIAFIKSAYGLAITPVALAHYDIDHLLNRARAGQGGETLLRVEALPRATNRQWGALIERLASSDLIAGNQRRRRLMSYLIAGKVAGFAPPADLADVAGRTRLARQLASLGLDVNEVRRGLDGMLEHIARNQP